MKLRFVLTAIVFYALGVLTVLFFGGNDAMYEEIERLEHATVFSYDPISGTIILEGAINTKAFDDFKKVANAYPKVKTISIVNCEGSINDDVNLALSKYVHDNKYSIVLKSGGFIASGGTDFFLAGISRKLEENVKVGVHSWGGNNVVATDFPMGHENHKPYIDYYMNIGMTRQQAEEFYYFTINSASVEDVHWMTKEELKKFKFEKSAI